MSLPKLPAPPRSRGGVLDQQELERWFYLMWKAIGGYEGITWSVVDKNIASIEDIPDRRHELLQEIEVWASGTSIVKDKHISNADGKVWQDHVEYTADNPHGGILSEALAMLSLPPASSVNNDNQALQWM